MAANNLRVLYNNLADSASITATATASGYPTTNMQSDIKGLVWRSTSLLSTTITLTWTADQTLSAVILPYTNLSSTATINVVLKNSVGTVIAATGTGTAVTAIPYSVTAGSVSNYGYGGGSTARVYFTSTAAVRSVEITIVDSGGTQGYMEVSRIICGTYWVPTFNVDYGPSVEYKDLSQHSRAQSGNIITDNAPSYKVLTFTIGYMVAADRNNLISIFRQNGMRKSVWVSLFPIDAEPEKEYIFSIYGRLSQGVTITHPQYTQYTTSLTIEEV